MTLFRSTVAWSFQVLLMSAGATAMASSLVLPTSAQLAGHWALHQQEQVWTPTPDGIWLMNAEGTGITHLNRQKEGEYEGRAKTGAVLILQRAP
eukprot:gene23765-28378_t